MNNLYVLPETVTDAATPEGTLRANARWINTGPPNHHFAPGPSPLETNLSMNPTKSTPIATFTSHRIRRPIPMTARIPPAPNRATLKPSRRPLEDRERLAKASTRTSSLPGPGEKPPYPIPACLSETSNHIHIDAPLHAIAKVQISEFIQ